MVREVGLGIGLDVDIDLNPAFERKSHLERVAVLGERIPNAMEEVFLHQFIVIFGLEFEISLSPFIFSDALEELDRIGTSLFRVPVDGDQQQVCNGGLVLGGAARGEPSLQTAIPPGCHTVSPGKACLSAPMGVTWTSQILSS